MEDHVTQMCSNLFDKNGNKIDVNIVATVYLSAFEISAYLKKCTKSKGKKAIAWQMAPSS